VASRKPNGLLAGGERGRGVGGGGMTVGYVSSDVRATRCHPQETTLRGFIPRRPRISPGKGSEMEGHFS